MPANNPPDSNSVTASQSSQTQSGHAAPHNRHHALKHFVFYANASSRIGSGHVMRLLAIAQASCKQNIKVTFVYRECPQVMLNRLVEEGFACVELPQVFNQSHIESLEADAIFVDDYELSPAQWQLFESTSALLINLDDNISDKQVVGDVIVNPAPDATEQEYRAKNATALLCLGPSYTYLRDEFAKEIPSSLSCRNQLLITLGGADVKNMALYILAYLLANVPEDMEELNICVLLGSLNTSAKDALLSICKKNPSVSLIEQSNQVAKLMNDTGLAVSAAGGTLGELACMGVPTIALVSSDNQIAALNSPLVNTWYRALDVRAFTGQAPSQFDNDQIQAELSAQDQALLATITQQVYELWRDLCKRQQMNEAARQIIDSDGCLRIVSLVLTQLS